MAVLVTGVGYIGASLVEQLLGRGEEVVGFDNFFSTDRAVIARFTRNPRFHFIEGSVTDPDALRAAFAVRPITTVYSLAAQASAHPEAASPRYTEETNLIGPRLTLDCMREFNVSRLVFASSFKVYGSQLPEVVTEDTGYGAFGDLSHLSKCYVEKLMEMYASRGDLNCVAVRLGITYGISPVTKRDERFMTAPNKFSLQATRGEAIELYPGTGVPAGFIEVSDAAAVMLAAGDDERLTGYVPVNAVTEMVPVSAVADAVVRAAEARGLEVTVRRHQQERAETARGPVVVQSRLSDFFDQPRRRVGDTVGDIIDYFLAN